MLYMQRFRKQSVKGFTLVELMIVIAIIGLLSVVLVPKIGRSKDAAKDAGVLANARSIYQVATLLIDNYSNDDAGIAGFATQLGVQLGTSIQNPYNGSTAISMNQFRADVAVNIWAPTRGGKTNRNFADTNITRVAPWTDRATSVACEIYINPSGALEVTIYPFDKSGKCLSNLNNVIRVAK